MCGCKHALGVAIPGLRCSWASIATEGGSAHSPSKSVSAENRVLCVGLELAAGEKDPGLSGHVRGWSVIVAACGGVGLDLWQWCRFW